MLAAGEGSDNNRWSSVRIATSFCRSRPSAVPPENPKVPATRFRATRNGKPDHIQEETKMSATFSGIRTAHIVALAAIMLTVLTVGASAQNYGHHGGHPTPLPTPVPAVKSSYDPATSIIRDHRNRSSANGATSVPNGGQPK
jgi:hypothetical protein